MSPARVLALLGALALVVVARPASAQIVNAEALYKRSLEAGWHGQVEGTFGVQQGNIDVLDVGGGGQVQYQTLHPEVPGLAPFRRHRGFIVANGRFARQEGDAFISQSFAHARYTFMVHPRIGPEAFVQHQYNEFLRLRTRFLVGGGARAILANLTTFQVTVGTGYMFELDERNLQEGSTSPPETRHHRWNNFFAIRSSLFDGNLLLQTNIYAQPRWNDFTDVRAMFQFEAEVSVNDWLSTSTVFTDQYDSQPPEGVEDLDVSLTQRVKVTF